MDGSSVGRVRDGLDRLFDTAGGRHDDDDARAVICLVAKALVDEARGGEELWIEELERRVAELVLYKYARDEQ